MKKSFSFFKASMRLWRRHLVGMLVAILGLACAFAFTMLGAITLYDSMTSDSWLPTSDRLYRVNEQWMMNGQKGVFGVSGAVTLKAGPLIRDNTPGLDAMTRLFPMPAEVRPTGSDTDFRMDILLAEPNMTALLAFPVLEGDMATTLNDPAGIVLRAQEARKLFGDASAIGQTLTVAYKEQKVSYRVGAVMADLPPNTHFDFAALAAWNEPLMQVEPFNLGTGAQAYTYVLAKPGTDGAALDEHISTTITDMLPRHGNIKIQLSAEPVRGSQYSGKAHNYMNPKPQKRMLHIQLIMAAVLVVAAGFNFVHMCTSINLGRGREVAIRRISGASRGHLMGVFLTETGGLAALAYLLGLMICDDFVAYAEQLGTEAISLFHPSHAGVLAVGLLIALLIGLCAAAAMLAQISRMKPQSLLHRSQQAVTGGGSRFKSVLVGLQALALVGSLVAAMQVYYQFNHFLTLDRGMRTEGALIVPMPFDETQSARFKNDFRKEMEALPGVLEVAEVNSPPYDGNLSLYNLKGPGDRDLKETIMRNVGPEYFDFFEITPVAKANEPFRDIRNVIALPERSLTAFGFASAEDAINQHLTSVYETNDGTVHTETFRIMAVVPDVKDDPYERKQPTVYAITDLYQTWFTRLVVRAKRDNEALQSAIRSLWLEHFPDFEEEANIRWYRELIEDRYRSTAMIAYTLAGMAAFCLLLCLAGLYGMASHYTVTRAREIALRRVLGAGKRDVSRLFLRKMLLPVAIGGVLSLVPTWWLMMRWMENHSAQAVLPLGVYPLTLVTIILVAALMLMGHVRRVLRLRPASVLYHE